MNYMQRSEIFHPLKINNTLIKRLPKTKIQIITIRVIVHVSSPE